VLSGIFSSKVVSNDFLASVEVKSFPFNREMMVLANLSNFLGDSPSAVARGVPAMTSTRSRIFPTFSLVTGPSMVIECLTPSMS
jgi:hypothetical protein